MILVPDNVNVFSWKELSYFIESLQLSLYESPESLFQYLDEFTQGEYINKGQKLFLITNTWDNIPNKVFVVGWKIDYVREENFVKEYIVREYKQF